MQISKAARIESELMTGKRTPREIAAIFGVLPEYVRVVRQRMRNRQSEGYTVPEPQRRSAAARFAHRYHNDPEFRHQHLSRKRRGGG